jgi:hypothetical protein
LIFGGNYVFRSDDRGDTWRTISLDLTCGRAGPSPHTGHTITALAESPRRRGLLYAGSDDGRLHVSPNGGETWIEYSARIPKLTEDRWISRIECSHHADDTAYLAIDRHRHDDLRPYLFKTTDQGASWTSSTGNLPQEGPVYVVRESSRNKDLLFAGTEQGLFVSANGGRQWQRLRGLPTVPVHDLVIHPRDRDLVIGTHGRGIWILDIAPLEELTAAVLAADAHLFEVKPAAAFRPRKPDKPTGTKDYKAPNPPFGAVIWYHLKAKPAQPVAVTITDPAGKKVVADLIGAKEAGLHRLVWDLRPAGDKDVLVAPGEYLVRLKAGGRELTKRLLVEAE